MRLDRNGNPDVCRSVAVPLTSAQVEQMDSIKLKVNEIIEEIDHLYTNSPRYEALARTALEEAVMWVVKAICTPGPNNG